MDLTPGLPLSLIDDWIHGFPSKSLSKKSRLSTNAFYSNLLFLFHIILYVGVWMILIQLEIRKMGGMVKWISRKKSWYGRVRWTALPKIKPNGVDE